MTPYHLLKSAKENFGGLFEAYKKCDLRRFNSIFFIYFFFQKTIKHAKKNRHRIFRMIRLAMPRRCRCCFIVIFMLLFLINIWITWLSLVNIDSTSLEDHQRIHPRYTTRLKKIQQNCNELQLNNVDILKLPKFHLQNIIIDQKHKFFYCYTPKVACTTWKRMLMVITGLWNNTNFETIPGRIVHKPKYFKKFSTLTLNEKKEALNNFTKFMIVRDPFERLLSAYRDKLETYINSEPVFQSIAKIIVKNRHLLQKYVPFENKTLEEINKKHHYDVKFYQFIQYLLSPVTAALKNHPHNEHWKPMYELCHPCLINYTIIAKYETVEDDSNFVLDKIGVYNLKFPPIKPFNLKTRTRLKKYYRSIPLDIILKIYDFYKIDFELFGYDAIDFLKKIYSKIL